MINGQEAKSVRFKDVFATICNNHHLSLSTQRAYWHWARYCIKWHKITSAEELSDDATSKFKSFLSYLANDDVAAATQNQAFNALRFLFEKVIGVELGPINGITRAIRHERFIDVPDSNLARRLVESVPGKCGLALRLIFGTAMRLNDCLRLRVKDVDFKRKQIAIQESKGGKSRLVPLPESMAMEIQSLMIERIKIHSQDLADGFGWVHLPYHLARKYPEDEKSEGWQYLFASDRISKDPRSGKYGRHHLMDVTLQQAFAKARKRLRVKRHYTIHGLRHCTSQFWEKNGIAHSDIMKLLGHSHLDTTQRYLRSGKSGMPSAPTPI